MSYAEGWLAINMEMPKRVPRTEYSAEGHWELMQAVTGIRVSQDSPDDLKVRGIKELYKKWNYAFLWSTLISGNEFGLIRTDMGHAEYAAGGIDKRAAGPSLFQDPEEVLNFDPWEAYGTKNKEELKRRFEQDYKDQMESFSSALRMTGIYVTLVSGLIEIFGWEMLLLAAGTDLVRFGELANRYASWMQQYFDALAEANVPLVMVHDDLVWTAGPFIHPDWYRKYVFPHYHKFFEPLVASGKKIAFTSDGNYTMFLDDIVAAGADGFCFEPSTDMGWFAEKYGKTHFFIGNADTRVLLLGDKPQIRSEVERCMSIGKDYPGFFMAVGNHIPPNTPVENAMYYNEVYETLRNR